MDTIKSTIETVTGQSAANDQPAPTTKDKLDSAAKGGNAGSDGDGGQTESKAEGEGPATAEVDKAHPEQVSDFIRGHYKSAPVDPTEEQ
ncbi:MAG: hypothetical protein M1838_002721 [Thelocarpon superellum]|nr:MAG: hypothetical protein M1838_002721 [Thelocarpon superellum]